MPRLATRRGTRIRLIGTHNRSIIAGVLAVGLLGWIGTARAETTELHIARQLGLGYLQLYIAEGQHLVEKHAKQDGLGDIHVSFQPLGNPSVITDAVLSGSSDLGATGVPPFILLWGKTHRGAEVKGLTALNAQPAFLDTNKARIRSLKDFGPQDRIAVPAVKSSFQAIVLQMAAEQSWGAEARTRLDDLTVSMAHPDAAVALISGKTEITGHFTSPPFQYQELQHSNVHKVLSSYDITGPASFSALWTTKRFHDANPRLIRAVIEAVDEATDFIKKHPGEAAKIFVEVEKSPLSPDFVAGMLSDPDIRYSAAPQNILKFSSFMTRTGMIKEDAKSWKDLFFSDIHDREGS